MLLAEREAVVAACRALVEERLVVGTAGNVSVRQGDFVAISPSGFDYLAMTASDVPVIDLEGARQFGDYEPSSEWQLHLGVYRTSAHSAVVHTHATASTALSTVVDEVPMSHYYTALFGGAIRVAPYATYGSPELAVAVEAAMRERRGALLGNHGAVVAGKSLKQAMDLARYLEYVCEVQLKAMATGAPVKVLPASEIEKVQGLLGGYGQGPR